MLLELPRLFGGDVEEARASCAARCEVSPGFATPRAASPSTTAR